MENDLIAPIPGDIRFADLGTHTIAYSDIGAGEPILFLHGGLMDHQSWGNQLPLADDFRLLLPDTRGHGRSGGAGLPATYAAFAGDAVRLLDHLGLERAALVGFSDGGCAALHVAVKHPDRLSALILIGTPYNLSNYSDGVVAHFSTMTPEALEANARPLLAEIIRKIRTHMSDEEWQDYFTRVIHGLWPNEPTFALSDFANVPVPTLILHGENERSFGLHVSEDLAATIPGCRLVVVPNASHAAAQDEPIYVNEVVSRFLAAKPPNLV